MITSDVAPNLIPVEKGNDRVSVAPSSAQARSEVIKNWAQIIAIMLAGLWAILTFGYKELMLPGQQKAVLTGELSLTNVGSTSDLAAIEMEFQLHNKSSRKAHLSSCIFLVWGVKYDRRDPRESDFYKEAGSLFNADLDRVRDRYLLRREFVLLSAGRLLSENRAFDAQESDSQTVVLHVPKDEYEAIDVLVLFRYSHEDNLEIEWIMTKEKRDHKVFRVAGKERIRVDHDDQEFREESGYTFARTHEMYSF